MISPFSGLLSFGVYLDLFRDDKRLAITRVQEFVGFLGPIDCSCRGIERQYASLAVGQVGQLEAEDLQVVFDRLVRFGNVFVVTDNGGSLVKHRTVA